MRRVGFAAALAGVLAASFLAAGGAGPPATVLRVVGEDGMPVPGAWLSCRAAAPVGEVVAVAGADGLLPVDACPEGPAWVGAPGFVPRRLEGSEREVRLARGATLDVRVTDAAGAPVAALVSVRDRLREQVAGPATGGRVRVGGLVSGGVRLRVSAPGFLAVERQVTVASPGMHTEIVVLPRPAAVSLRLGPGGDRQAVRGGVRVRPAEGLPGETFLDGGQPVVPREGSLSGPARAVPLPWRLPAGVPLVLDVVPEGCAPVRLPVQLPAGEAAVRVPCHRGTITGEIALPGEQDVAPRDIEVCALPVGTKAREMAAWSGRSCVVVGGDGRFLLGPLAPGKWRLAVRAPAGLFLRGKVTVQVGEAGAAAAGVLRLEEGFVLAGKVVDDEGPVAGARVRVAPEGHGRWWGPAVVTGEDGAFSLGVPDHGPWLVRASAPGRPPLVREHVRAPADDLVLRPGRGASVTFRFLDPDGLPIRAARLLLLSPRGGRLVEARNVRGDEDGNCSIEGLPAGTFTVKVLAPGFSPVLVPRVELMEDDTRDLGELVAGRGRILAGIVLDPEGNPVAGALLRPWPGGEGAEFSGSTGPDGRFRVPGVPAKAFDLVVTAAGLAPAVVPVPAEHPEASASDVEIRLPRGGRVRCRVEDASGSPVRDALVTVAGLAEVLREETGSDGIAVLEHVPPGRVTLRASVDPTDPVSGMLEKEAPVPEDGETEVVLRPGAVLAGVVTRRGVPRPGVRVIAVPTGGDRRATAARTDDEGRFRLGLPSPGTWSIEVEDAGCRYHRPVEVAEEGGEIEIPLPPVDLAGRVIAAEDEVPVPGAEVSWSAPGRTASGRWPVDLPDGGWESVAWDTAPGAVAVTDAEGEWELCVPESGPFGLRVEAGREWVPWHRDVEEPPPSPLVVPLERRQDRLRIRVRLADGEVAGANVGLVVEQAGGGESVTFLPPGGVRELLMPRRPFRAWAIVRGYGLAVTDWIDPARDEVPEDGLLVTVERGGWIRISLAPELARKVDPATFRLHLYDDRGADLFWRVQQVGAIENRPGNAPGEVLLGVFPRGTWTLAWEAGEVRGRTPVVVDEDPPPVVLGGD